MSKYGSINKWLHGYKVSGEMWYTSTHYYINVAYFAPGSSINREPDKEKSFLIPLSDIEYILQYLDTFVLNCFRIPGDGLIEIRKGETTK